MKSLSVSTSMRYCDAPATGFHFSSGGLVGWASGRPPDGSSDGPRRVGPDSGLTDSAEVAQDPLAPLAEMPRTFQWTRPVGSRVVTEARWFVVTRLQTWLPSESRVAWTS